MDIDLLKQQVNECKDEIRIIRETLHTHPEPGFHEYNTARLIADTLKKQGYTDIRTDIGQTGVLATVYGAHSGPVIMLRVDMDAMEGMDDSITAPYASVHKGICHSCGHDVHTALGVGVAGILMHNHALLHGVAKIFFQPSEEKPLIAQDQPPYDCYTEPPVGQRSAYLAMKEGILDNPRVDRLIGIHCWPLLNAGYIGYQYGAAMAGTGNFHITIFGQCGHIGMPHKATDAIILASQVISALQVAVNRCVNPLTPLVLNVGTVRGGIRRSVICGQVDMTGTVRCADPSYLSNQIPNIMEKVISHTCQTMGGSYIFDYGVDQPPVINNDLVVAQSVCAIKKILGERAIELHGCSMTAEDFSFLSQEIPAVYLKLGTAGSNPDTQFPLHSSSFDVDPDCYEIGLLAVSGIILDYLKAFSD